MKKPWIVVVGSTISAIMTALMGFVFSEDYIAISLAVRDIIRDKNIQIGIFPWVEGRTEAAERRESIDKLIHGRVSTYRDANGVVRTWDWNKGRPVEQP